MKHKALWKGHILPLHLTGSIQTFSFCREREWPFSLSLICHRSRSRSNLLESSPRSCCRWTACLDHRPSRWSVRPHTAPWAGPQDRDPSTRWWWNRLQLHPGDETSVCDVFAYSTELNYSNSQYLVHCQYFIIRCIFRIFTQLINYS